MSLYLPIAQISMDVGLLTALGLAVGILSGLFGIGGGFIMTPLLIFMGVPPFVAVGTGASQVVASSVSGALTQWRRKNVDVKLGFVLLGGGLVGASLGVKLQQALKAAGQLDVFTTGVYVVMLGFVGLTMLVESLRALRAAAGAVKRPRAGGHSWLDRLPFKQRFRVAKLYISALPPFGMGTGIGILTAIMGVGGGFLLIPALIYGLRLSTRIAVGTSAFQIVFLTSYTTLLQATQNTSVDLFLALPLMLGGVLGAQMGVRMGETLNAAQLRLLLSLMVLLVAGRMAVDLMRTPSELFAIEEIPAATHP